MSWHLAPALAQLRAEVNKRWPKRSKRSDGTIGDAAHSARKSDHNPNARRSVNAIDITASGIDTGALIAAAKRHPSVRYIIFNRRIMNRDIGNFRPRRYTGSNPHTAHVHISIYQSRTAENRRQSWGIATAKAPAGGGSSSGGTYREVRYGDLLKLYTKGAPVREWQRTALGYTGKAADGFFGPDTERDTKRFQREHGVTADGIVGPASWPLRLKKSQPKPAPKRTGKVPGPGHVFPLPSGYYFGPKGGGNRSVSGFYNRKFRGKTDRYWLQEFGRQLARRGWSVGKGKTWLKRAGNDGKYGGEYAALIRRFQQDQGLRADSLLGEKTWDAAFKNPVT